MTKETTQPSATTTEINQSLRKLKILVSGMTTSGKSTITKNLPNPERVVYLNCDTVQRPAFKNPGFAWINIKNVLDLPETLENIIEKNKETNKFDLIVLDTLTNALSRFIKDFQIAGLGGTNAFAVWAELSTYFESLVSLLNSSGLGYIVLAHAIEETTAGETTLKVVTEGKKIGSLGIEHKFESVLVSKQVPIAEVTPILNDYLDITKDDKLRGTKYVIQTSSSGTRPNYTVRVCSPENMFLPEEAYINNDIRAVIALNDAYLEGSISPKTVEEIWKIPKQEVRKVMKKGNEESKITKKEEK